MLAESSSLLHFPDPDRGKKSLICGWIGSMPQGTERTSLQGEEVSSISLLMNDLVFIIKWRSHPEMSDCSANSKRGKRAQTHLWFVHQDNTVEKGEIYYKGITIPFGVKPNILEIPHRESAGYEWDLLQNKYIACKSIGLITHSSVVWWTKSQHTYNINWPVQTLVGLFMASKPKWAP